MALIEVDRVSFAYRKAPENPEAATKQAVNIPVLCDVSFKVESGELIALQGASGSGKSTLMALLAGFLKLQTGEIRIQGEALSPMEDEKLAFLRNQKIGFIFQQFHLLPKLNVLENILLPLMYGGSSHKDLLRERAISLANELGLGDRLDHRPNQLSGGQQQRVAIARALLFDPEIILADEPTGNLDSQSAQGIMDILRELHQRGKTILVITHSPEIAQQCHKVIVIKDGRLEKISSDSGQSKMRSSSGALEEDGLPHEKEGRSFWKEAEEVSRDPAWSVFFRGAWQNIITNKMRSILTMIGVMVGVGSIFSMLTLGDFLREKVLESYAEMGIDTLLFVGYPNWQATARNNYGVQFQSFHWERDILPLKEIFKEIEVMSPLISGMGVTFTYAGLKIENEGRTVGVNEMAVPINGRKILEGRNFSTYHLEQKNPVCIIGSEVKERLFSRVSPLNQVLNVQSQDLRFGCKVIGVFAPLSSNKGYSNPNLEVYLPFTFYQSVSSIKKDGAIRRVLIRLKPEQDIARIGRQIRGYFVARYGDTGNFRVNNDSVLVAQLQKFLGLFKGGLASIALICLLVGGMGITNMMLASISERYREIGLKKALGASDRVIRKEIFTETLLLCGLAGFCGVAAGFAFYEFVIFVAAQFVSQVVFEWKLNGMALVLSLGSILLVGLATGIAPSQKARRLQILEALKSD